MVLFLKQLTNYEAEACHVGDERLFDLPELRLQPRARLAVLACASPRSCFQDGRRLQRDGPRQDAC